MSNVMGFRALVVFAEEPDGSKVRKVTMRWQPAGLLQGRWWMQIEGHGRECAMSRVRHLDCLCATLNVLREDRDRIEANMLAIEQQEAL